MCAKHSRRADRRRPRRHSPTWSTGSARDRVSIELTHHGHPRDDERNAALAALAPRFGVGVVATTAAHFAEPSRGRLAMAMGAIRARNSMDEAAGLACAAWWFAPAVGGGDGAVVRPPPRGGDGRGRTRRAVRVRAGAHRPAAATVRRARRDTPRTAGCGTSPWSAPATGTARRSGLRWPTRRSSTS